mgnify:FL=1|tara:strand:+ start:405 stop:1820 length:1416 start_codon:yes stop_codon:yes gene_type:complete
MIEQSGNFFIFLGRFHHLFNHFPIALIILIFFIEFASRFEVFRKLNSAITPLLLLATISTLFASLLGFILYKAGGYTGGLVEFHMWLGISLSVMVLLTYLIRIITMSIEDNIKNIIYLCLLTITTGTVVITGHQGGSLVHGKGYLTEFMPKSLKGIISLSDSKQSDKMNIINFNEAVVFSDIVEPIFEARCLTCHKTSNNKGGLSLETPDEIQLGGDAGSIIIPGNSEMSEIVRRIVLPLDDELRMPKGKSPLSEVQVQLISWWIDEGASFTKKVSESNVSDDIQSILKKVTKNTIVEDVATLATIPAIDTILVKELQDSGFHIWRIAQNSDLLRIVYVKFGDSKFTNEDLIKLKPLKSNIAWLDIGGSQITDEGMMHLSTFHNLERIHLENTGITDNGIESLISLNKLTYLNLHGTKITNSSLEQIGEIQSLKSLYIWNTNVTEEGIKQLKEKNPNLIIESGLRLSAREF